VHAVEIERIGIDGGVARIRERAGDHPLYISIDIDVLDPAHAPGTGTPEAGGLTSRELLGFLRGLAGMPVAGADVVEVAPAYDHAEMTAIAAAHVCFDLLALILLGDR
jgi:agmatinase